MAFGVGAEAARLEQLLIVQATPFCNIDCKYCYLPDRANAHRMAPATFERVLGNVLQSGVFPGGFTIAWHAGEPLAAPISFYRECVAITDRHRGEALDIRHNIQTNATLIDERWAEFLRDASFEIGVSVDGPAFLNDANRLDRAGRGTFAKVERGMAMLRDHDVPFAIICVLTARHLDHVEALFDFLRKSGAHSVNFNFDEEEGGHGVSSFRAEGAVDRFRRFAADLLDLNDRAGRPVVFSNLEIDLLGDERETMRNHQIEPWRIIAVDWQGNACTFSPELLGMREPRFRDFNLGNLAEQPLAEIAGGQVFRALHAEIARGVERCRTTCSYFHWCGGGAPGNKYFEHGTFDAAETLYCRMMRQALCEVNLERLQRNVDRLAHQRRTDGKPVVG